MTTPDARFASATGIARWIHNAGNHADTVNLFMDYETFGEHQWAETGIFDFVEHLVEQEREAPT